MCHYVIQFYVDLIAYPCHNPDAGLANLCYWRRPEDSNTKLYKATLQCCCIEDDRNMGAPWFNDDAVDHWLTVAPFTNMDYL